MEPKPFQHRAASKSRNWYQSDKSRAALGPPAGHFCTRGLQHREHIRRPLSEKKSQRDHRGFPKSSGYGPSKAALTNFAESIYCDFKKHNVKVTVVSPGFIKTPLTGKNEFPMPFLRSPEFAADKLYSGLVKTNSFEIDFPIQLTFSLKFLRILP